MIIYKDIVTNDELLSDSYPIEEIENGAMLKVQASFISVGGEEINVGGNPSAEGGDEGVEDSTQRVLDLEHSFRLQGPQTYEKSPYMDHLKGYFIKIKENMRAAGKSEEEVKEFEKKAAPMAKKIMKEIGEYDVYRGESLDNSAMFVMMRYPDGATAPYALYWKHGLKEEKV